MANLRISNNAQKAALDAATALINVGGAGTLEFYSGAQPATPEGGIGAAVLLGVCTFSATAFGATDASGVATAAAITSDSNADAGGVAAWCRAKSGAGVAVFDSDAGEAADSATVTLDNKTIVAGGVIAVSAFTLTIPSGV